jgi:hypothetical protein
MRGFLPPSHVLVMWPLRTVMVTCIWLWISGRVGPFTVEWLIIHFGKSRILIPTWTPIILIKVFCWFITLSMLFNDAFICKDIPSVVEEWVLSNGGMILTGENRSTRRRTCRSATSSTTNPMRTGVGLKPDIRDDMPVTNHLSHGTAPCVYVTTLGIVRTV